MYEPRSDTWRVLNPWTSVHGEPSTDEGDRYHLNSVIHDGESFVLSVFTSQPKPSKLRWRDFNLEHGLILRWDNDGFADKPLAEDVYAPHSLRLHDGYIWWCDSFRARVCRDDGWSSPHLGGLARGLRFVGDKCVVGLSKSRVAPNPEFEQCGLCVFDPRAPQATELVEVEPSYFEIYDLFPLDEEELT